MTLGQAPVLLRYKCNTDDVEADVVNSVWITATSGTLGLRDDAVCSDGVGVEERFEESTDELEKASQTVGNERKSPVSLKKQIVIVVLAFLMAMFIFGHLIGLGVLFMSFRESFGSSRAQAALVISVCAGTLLGGSALVSPMLIKFGPGPVGCVGALTATSGFVISYIAPSLSVLIIGAGCITGCGLCAFYTLIYPVVGAAIESHKWRDFSLSVVASGAGVGGAVFPVFNEFLVETFGWRGAMLLLGGIMLQYCPMVLIMGSLSRDLAKQRNDETPEVTSHKKLLNLSLFTNVGFLLTTFSIFVLMTLVTVVNLFLPDMAKDKGFDAKTGAFFLSLSSLTSLIGRVIYLISSAMADFQKITLMAILFLLTGVCMIALTFANSYRFMCVAIAIYNVPWGAMFISIPVVVLEVAGKHRFTSAMGYTGLLSGIATFVGSPIAGAIKDKTGSYNGVVFIAVAGCCTSALCMFILSYTRRPARKTQTVVESKQQSND